MSKKIIPGEPVKLTDRQRMFIHFYLQCFNMAEAGRRAGYSPTTAEKMGNENYHKPHVYAEIQKGIEAKCMGKDEVLTRLADHARGDMGEFLTPGTVNYDVKRAEGKTHLLKRLKTKTKSYTPEGADQPITETDVEFELHDPQAALVQIGRHLKLFTDKTELTALVGMVTSDELAAARSRMIEEEKRLLGDDGSDV